VNWALSAEFEIALVRDNPSARPVVEFVHLIEASTVNGVEISSHCRFIARADPEAASIEKVNDASLFANSPETHFDVRETAPGTRQLLVRSKNGASSSAYPVYAKKGERNRS
jgi:hypothetical protein